jgi:hypothetical protein
MENTFADVSRSTGLLSAQVAEILGNQQLSVIENIGKQVSSMSKESAKDYLETWGRVTSDSKLNADSVK